MSNHILEKIANVKALFFDVDGVMTDGSILALESGEQSRIFNIKDGLALNRAN
jgi:3-deoxy-D-manno-octulosonate 8-phosphate phosphatase (KDO 8-P phosphatase)